MRGFLNVTVILLMVLGFLFGSLTILSFHASAQEGPGVPIFRQRS